MLALAGNHGAQARVIYELDCQLTQDIVICSVFAGPSTIVDLQHTDRTEAHVQWRAYQSTNPCLQLRRQLPTLLRSMRRDQIHQHRTQNIICRQPLLLELLSHSIDLVRLEALLDDTAHERRELRLLPSLGVAQFGVDEVQALEGVLVVNATEQMNAALLAGVTLDGRAWVEDVELVAVGGDLYCIYRDDADDREECALRFPAF